MRVQWPLHDSGEGHKCLVFRKSHRHVMQISCVVIENAINTDFAGSKPVMRKYGGLC